MPWLQIFQGIGTLVSVMGTMKAAQAEQDEADRRARELEEERKRNAIQAAQNHNDTLASYDEDVNINDSMLYVTRDTSDISLDRFFKKEEEKVGEEVVRLDRMALMTDDKYRREAIGVKRAGEARAEALRFRAVTKGIQGLYDFRKNWTGE
mgnify:CR=1 FL=1|tara:strand:- start:9245 stop:9697 length:453 start_codon:yes stop_codon:yes gene_type:complete